MVLMVVKNIARSRSCETSGSLGCQKALAPNAGMEVYHFKNFFSAAAAWLRPRLVRYNVRRCDWLITTALHRFCRAPVAFFHMSLSGILAREICFSITDPFIANHHANVAWHNTRIFLSVYKHVMTINHRCFGIVS